MNFIVIDNKYNIKLMNNNKGMNYRIRKLQNKSKAK